MMHPLRRIKCWLSRRRDRVIFALPPAVIAHPFEIFISFLCMIAALPLLANGPASTPDSIDDLLPVAMVYGWALSLLLGGICVVVGKFTEWYYVERAGMAFLAAGTLVYSLAIAVTAIQLHNYGTFFACGTYLFFALAAAVRYAVLGVTISRIRESLK